MNKKIFQFMILCGLAASVNGAMAEERKPLPLPLDPEPCHVACNALVMYSETTGEKFKVECTYPDCGAELYNTCLKNCTPKKE